MKYERYDKGACPIHGEPTPVYLYDSKRTGEVTQYCIKCKSAAQRARRADLRAAEASRPRLDALLDRLEAVLPRLELIARTGDMQS